MIGLVIVCFCLFLWMFLLGIWAGQTILLPVKGNRPIQAEGTSKKMLPKTATEDSPIKDAGRSTGP
jgi:hypothetical protein